VRRSSPALYRSVSLGLALIFAAVGAAFLFLPGGVIRFMNSIARLLGMSQAPPVGHNIYLVLAVSYMSVVTLMAWLMYRNPLRAEFPLLLTQAKLTSSVLSFGLFVFHRPYFIYLANGIVDGSIGILVLFLAQRLKPILAPEK